MKKIRNQKGEITTQQIVFLIILITSFVVILFFLFRLNLGEISNKEICHNSVVLKGKSIISGDLDCRTNYVCISGGEKCEGINPTQTIEINPDDRGEVLKAIADEMADCWWMFGEGKVDYLGIGDKSPLGNNVCAVCSIVKFDRKIQEKYPDGISYEGFIEESLIKPKDTQDTYLSYIYGVNSEEDLYEKFEVIKEDVDSEKFISFKERYMVRTGFSTGSLWGQLSSDSIIYPYFFDTNNIPDPQCDEFITKA